MRRVHPLYPSPRVLVPYGLLELEVVEPESLRMAEDCLDGPGRIVLATVREGEEEAEIPSFHPVASLGEIGRHDRLPDGGYRLILVGLKRVLATEVESHRGYRMAEVQPAPEVPVPREREAELRRELVRAIRQRTSGKVPIPPRIPTSSLADHLLLRMPLSRSLMIDLYSELDTEKRARGALAQHAVLPNVDPGSDDDASESADG